MGKSIRSKIKRKYRAQRAGTVEALGIVESKEKKKQEALQSSMTPSMLEKVRPMRVACSLHDLMSFALRR